LTFTKFTTSKEFLSGTTAGLVALFVLSTFVWPVVTENASAVVDLQIEQAIIMTSMENQKETLDRVDNQLTSINTKLDKLIIILCQNSDSSFCN
jgi:dolichol kinase